MNTSSWLGNSRFSVACLKDYKNGKSKTKNPPVKVHPTGEAGSWREELKRWFQGPDTAWDNDQLDRPDPQPSHLPKSALLSLFKYRAFNDYHSRSIWLGVLKMGNKITPNIFDRVSPSETSRQRKIHSYTRNKESRDSFQTDHPQGEKNGEAWISPWGRKLKTTISLSHQSSSQKLSKSSSE